MSSSSRPHGPRSLVGFAVHGIFQARGLERIARSYGNSSFSFLRSCYPQQLLYHCTFLLIVHKGFNFFTSLPALVIFSSFPPFLPSFPSFSLPPSSPLLLPPLSFLLAFLSSFLPTSYRSTQIFYFFVI